MLPPPNVTGTLHMGHAFQHTLMDALIRYHRMRGRQHAVAAGHRPRRHRHPDRGRAPARRARQVRHDLGREKFVERVWQWKEQSGSTITRQMRRLGHWEYADWSASASPWTRACRGRHRGVRPLCTNKGLIYRGKRLVNWDPVLQTASPTSRWSARKKTASIWEIRYPLEDGSGDLTVATTRPETMLGDTAVAVHPEDARYAT
jgi:valyl-tRNA synthetase